MKIISRFIISLFCLLLFFQNSISQTRIACVGNSITDGISMSTREYDSWPAALQRYLGNDFDVGNFGYSGRTMLKNGDFPLWDEQVFTDAINFNPNIVIILLGTNDTKPQNWIYKDEFLTDYYAMIDTFRQGTANPDIYVCYPPPSFSDAYDIRNSVIVNDIIPMIGQIVDSVDVTLVDLNTPFLDKSYLMPDGIHPLVEGSDYMARIYLEALTGRTIENQKETNVALNRPAKIADQSFDEITDGNTHTFYEFTSMEDPLIISLDSIYEIDLAQFDFSAVDDSSINLKIETSLDSNSWATVVDSLINTTVPLKTYFFTFNPVQVQYIRFRITTSATFQLNETRIYESRTIHAPSLRWEYRSESATVMRSRVYPERITNSSEYVKIYRQQGLDNPFELVYGYRGGTLNYVTTNMFFGDTQRLYAVALKDDIAISSDTLSITGQSVNSINENSADLNPKDYYLYQNYPNPFNPQTQIEFYLSTSSTASLDIVDIAGKIVYKTAATYLRAGTHRIKWDGKNLRGTPAASGIYFYRLNISGSIFETKKMILLR